MLEAGMVNSIKAHITTPEAIEAADTVLTLALSLFRYPTIPPTTNAAPSIPSVYDYEFHVYILLPFRNPVTSVSGHCSS